MPDSRLQDLPEATSLGGDELLYLVDSPSGTPVDRKVTVNTLAAASTSMTQISQTTLSGATTTITVPQTYKRIFVHGTNIKNDYTSTTRYNLYVRCSGDTTSPRHMNQLSYSSNTITTHASTYWNLGDVMATSYSSWPGFRTEFVMELDNYTAGRAFMRGSALCFYDSGIQQGSSFAGVYNHTGAVTSLTFWSSSSNLVAGTVTLWGIT